MSEERERQRIEAGDKVRFRAGKIAPYRAMYGVTVDDVFDVARVEPRGTTRALYLAAAGRESWVPAWPSALILVQRHKGGVVT